MKKKDIRLAVVGWGTPNAYAPGSIGGRGAGLFMESVKFFDGIIPVAVCDTNPESLKCAQEKFPDSKVFSDFDKMIAEVPLDAVIIGTPATFHAELAIKALRRNIHVLSEIPSVHSLDEAGPLWKAHLESKAIYMTGSNANFAGYWDTAVDLKQKGLFGDPIYAEASYMHKGDGRTGLTAKTPWRATFVPILYCTHSLGPLLRVIDEDLEWVSCFDTGSHMNKIEGQHDAMAALFRTPSNVVIRLLISFINNYLAGGHAYRVFTTKGCFERTPPYRTFRKEPAESQRTLFYTTDLPVFNNWIELPIAAMPVGSAANPIVRESSGHGSVDYPMLGAFFKAIREGLPSPLSLKDGLRMTLPGIYAAESARQGGALLRIRYPWNADTV